MVFNAVKTLSDILGADEAALKLLLSVLSGYPLAIFHRQYLYGREKWLQHTYFIATSFLIGYLNYDKDILHPFFSMLVTYVILKTLGGSITSVVAVFVFNMLYLCIGYHVMSTDSYDINWTMPFCVLVLRLIGVSFDYYDGQEKQVTSADKKLFMLKELPNLLEFFGFASFPASFWVGPQFPMRRYQSYINGEFGSADNLKKPPDSEVAALKRFGLGVFYLCLFQILGLFISDSFITSEDYRVLSFGRKHLLLGLWGRFTLYKYISCWLLAEGSCILFGITYNGTNERNEKQWNGLENVKLSVIENTLEFNDYIHSFNINTNRWVAHYIYKRLKFLNNKHLSQIGALLFLAIWHGEHSGYFVCFSSEFLVLYLERDVKSIVKRSARLSQFFNHHLVAIAVKLILRLYTFVFMGYCLLPFVLLTFDRYWHVFLSTHFSGLILFLLYPILWGPILHAIFDEKKKDL